MFYVWEYMIFTSSHCALKYSLGDMNQNVWI